MMLIIVIVSSVIGVLLFKIYNTENQSIENSGQKIVQEMENMETTYKLPQKAPKGDVQID